MNALALFNTFEKEMNKPFFRSTVNFPTSNFWEDSWLTELTNSTNKDRSEFLTSLKFDEKESLWTLLVELAGVSKENIKIDTTSGSIRLSGEKTKGIHTGPFEFMYNLPENIDEEKITAIFEDGVLNIKMPLVEKKLAKSIQIK